MQSRLAKQSSGHPFFPVLPLPSVLATNSPCNHNLAVHARQLPYRQARLRQRGSSATADRELCHCSFERVAFCTGFLEEQWKDG